jgi:hypothetical protein
MTDEAWHFVITVGAIVAGFFLLWPILRWLDGQLAALIVKLTEKDRD